MNNADVPILVTNDYPPAHGGIQRLMGRLAVGIDALGEEVVVVAPRLAGSRAFDAASKVRVVRYPLQRAKWATILAMTIGYVRALGMVRERSTIASIWWPAGMAVALLPRAVRGPYIVLAHGSEIAPSRKGLRRAVMRFVYGRADAVVANSRFTQALLESAGVRKNLRTFRMGVDAATVEPNRAQQPTILSVGRLVERKGFDLVIAAVAALGAEFPALRYEIVGEGPQLPLLRETAERLGIRDRVVFLGSVADDEMWQAYARAWCFVLPVRSVGDDVEGFGIVYLEAAMASLPSIGGRASGASDAVEDGVTGLLVDGTSVDAVVSAIRTMLEDPGLRESMGRAARERAQREFSWAKSTESIVASFGS